MEGAPENTKVTALAYSKHRDALGLVGVEVDPQDRVLRVRLARQWPAAERVDMIGHIQDYYMRVNWKTLLIDQQVGEFIITSLRRAGLGVQVITSQKRVKDAAKIRGVKVLDTIEMTEFLATMQRNGQLRFPADPSRHMRELEEQMPFFSKHVTEAGAVDYYATGEEPDNLVRAMMAACFSARSFMLWRYKPLIATKKLVSGQKDLLGTALGDGDIGYGRHVHYPHGQTKNPPKYRIH